MAVASPGAASHVLHLLGLAAHSNTPGDPQQRQPQQTQVAAVAKGGDPSGHHRKLPPPTAGQRSPRIYSLTITINAEGTTDPTPGAYDYTPNSTVQVKAFPNAGCSFSHWLLGNRTVYGSPINIVMDANQTLLPYFIDIERPVADAGLNRTVNVGETVNFDASNSSDNVGIINYEWRFGDGTTGTGATATHKYTQTGTYIVTLTVKDVANNSGIKNLTITVEAPLTNTIYYIIVIAAIAIIAVAYFLLMRKHS